SAVETDGKSAIPFFMTGLQDRDPIVVRNAAVAPAFFSRPEAKPELVRGLKDPDDFRRWEAVFSLRTVGDQQIDDLLLPMLSSKNERDDQVRGEVALALGKLGGETSVDALLVALRQDPSPQVRWRSALSLGQRGDGTVVPVMEAARGCRSRPTGAPDHPGDAGQAQEDVMVDPVPA
ncbi:MAG: HEAT repeat domain-containing protein, partial [SAR202 cluster bacterium]|nr:HEAT repeat domain-containing protein [SAR202 cluster bacterium]